MTLHVEMKTLSLAQQVLYRQQGHAGRTGDFLEQHADIGDATGWLLGAFDPLSKAAITLAHGAANSLAQLHVADALAITAAANHIKQTDQAVEQAFHNLLTSFDAHPTFGPYMTLAGPKLGPAGESAPSDYGHVPGMFLEKAYDAGKNVAGAVGDVTGLIHDATQLTHGQQVSELVDASSYLVPGQAGEDPVSDLRWSAGALLGSIDWVAEHLLGFSILERYVFKPFAGDWEGIFKASQSWDHAGDAMGAIAKNDAGLVGSTPSGWQGLSGDAFRGSATALCGAADKLGAAYGAAGHLVSLISTACKLACVGIGSALNWIANKLLEIAAKVATPVIGWAAEAVTAYNDINGLLKQMRMIDLVLETITNAINSFVDAKTDILDAISIIESLAKGALGSVKAPA